MYMNLPNFKTLANMREHVKAGATAYKMTAGPEWK
jgi:hypothetical protein